MTTATAQPTLGDPLITACLRAHDLAPEHVAAAVRPTGEVVVVTAGGVKLHWRPGEAPVALTRGQRGELVTCPVGHVHSADIPVCRQCLNIAAKRGDAKARAALTKSFLRYPAR